MADMIDTTVSVAGWPRLVCHDRWLQLDTGTIDTGTTSTSGSRQYFVRSGHCGVPGGDCGGPSGGRGEEWDVKHKTIGV